LRGSGPPYIWCPGAREAEDPLLTRGWQEMLFLGHVVLSSISKAANDHTFSKKVYVVEEVVESANFLELVVKKEEIVLPFIYE